MGAAFFVRAMGDRGGVRFRIFVHRQDTKVAKWGEKRRGRGASNIEVRERRSGFLKERGHPAHIFDPR